MAQDLAGLMLEVQAMLAGPVPVPCGREDDKGLPCLLRAGHAGEPIHCRMAVPGEPPYTEGSGNSVITWTAGPSVRKVRP